MYKSHLRDRQANVGELEDMIKVEVEFEFRPLIMTNTHYTTQH